MERGIAELSLQVRSGKLILDLMITERNKQGIQKPVKGLGWYLLESFPHNYLQKVKG
jgi:hypothetical protein